MTYQEAITAARAATTYEEADAVCKAMDEAYDTISDRQYYSIKSIALDAAYAAQANKPGSIARQAGRMKGEKTMKLYREESISNFDFWSGAKDTAKYLTEDEMDTIEGILEELYPDGMSETELNDFFWFEDDTIAEWLGYEDFGAIMSRNDEDEEDED